MKVKVIVSYIDKNTREYCGLGDVKDYPKERAEELIKLGHAAKLKPTKEPEEVIVDINSIG